MRCVLVLVGYRQRSTPTPVRLLFCLGWHQRQEIGGAGWKYGGTKGRPIVDLSVDHRCLFPSNLSGVKWLESLESRATMEPVTGIDPRTDPGGTTNPKFTHGNPLFLQQFHSRLTEAVDHCENLTFLRRVFRASGKCSRPESTLQSLVIRSPR